MKPSKVASKIKQSLTTILNINARFQSVNEELDEIKINQGILLSALNESRPAKDLAAHEFKVFSQWGEDGIIQHLVKTVEIKHRTFIEFGVEDFSESNCRFLLMKDNWQGFVIDGAKKNIDRLKNSYFYWKHDLQAIDSFITKDNINELLKRSGFDEDLGILSIDIDGNDYFVLEAIDTFKPRILICEYNAVFGCTRKISTPYEPDFYRTDKHHSNLYFGASLAAMTHLANGKGYTLVGTNSAGVNAFYVRNDLMNEKLEALSIEQAFRSSRMRESRDERGKLTYVSGDARLRLIEGMPVFNIELDRTEPL